MKKLNVEINKRILFVITVGLYIALLVLMFAKKDVKRGFALGWAIGIVIAFVGSVLTSLNLYEAWINKNWNAVMILLTTIGLLLVMAVFSILDFAKINNYLMTSITFVAFPFAALAINSINHKY